MSSERRRVANKLSAYREAAIAYSLTYAAAYKEAEEMGKRLDVLRRKIAVESRLAAKRADALYADIEATYGGVWEEITPHSDHIAIDPWEEFPDVYLGDTETIKDVSEKLLIVHLEQLEEILSSEATIAEAEGRS